MQCWLRAATFYTTFLLRDEATRSTGGPNFAICKWRRWFVASHRCWEVSVFAILCFACRRHYTSACFIQLFARGLQSFPYGISTQCSWAQIFSTWDCCNEIVSLSNWKTPGANTNSTKRKERKNLTVSFLLFFKSIWNFSGLSDFCPNSHLKCYPLHPLSFSLFFY